MYCLIFKYFKKALIGAEPFCRICLKLIISIDKLCSLGYLYKNLYLHETMEIY